MKKIQLNVCRSEKENMFYLSCFPPETRRIRLTLDAQGKTIISNSAVNILLISEDERMSPQLRGSKELVGACLAMKNIVIQTEQEGMIEIVLGGDFLGGVSYRVDKIDETKALLLLTFDKDTVKNALRRTLRSVNSGNILTVNDTHVHNTYKTFRKEFSYELGIASGLMEFIECPMHREEHVNDVIEFARELIVRTASGIPLDTLGIASGPIEFIECPMHREGYVNDVIEFTKKLIVRTASGIPLDMNAIFLAAHFHDIGRIVQVEGHEQIGANIFRSLFANENHIEKETKDLCYNIIKEHKVSVVPSSMESQIVKDADKIGYYGMHRRSITSRSQARQHIEAIGARTSEEVGITTSQGKELFYHQLNKWTHSLANYL